MNDSTHDTTVHSRLLRDRATKSPDAPFVRFPEFGGDMTWTFGDGQRVAEEGANALLDAGVRPGDEVCLFFESGPMYVSVLLACWRLGAAPLLINDAYIGTMLSQPLQLVQPALVITGSAGAERLRAVQYGGRVALVDPESACGLTASDMAAMSDGQASERPALETVEYPRIWDSYGVLMTSGTTGPSKAVRSPFGQPHAMLRDPWLSILGPSDVMLIDMPLFHTSGLLGLYVAVHTGCCLALYRKFSASRYWDRCRQVGATATHLLPAMFDFVWKQPPSPDDRRHSLHYFSGANLPYIREWQRRFGVAIYFCLYSSTETSTPLLSEHNPPEDRAVGRVRPGMRARLVDEHDMEVPAGAVGEMILRPDEPWEFFLEYRNQPDATAKAWRNGWFHTGDLFTKDSEGRYFIVDRLKDSIRRRGENVSSQEVEGEIIQHPGVKECAVVASPGDSSGEEEVRAIVVVSAEQTFSPEDLITFLQPRLPQFMLPRYIDVVSEIPRSSSFKVQKHELRAIPITDATFDREQVS